MPSFQIHRLREQQRQQFRQAPHTAGLTTVKPKDYEPGETVEAATPYAVWETMRNTDRPLQVGDIVEGSGGELRICKYVGFEEARWFVPEPVPAAADASSTPVALN